MKATEIIKTWFTLLTEPEKTVKKLQKKKLTTSDGLISVAILGMVGFLLLSIPIATTTNTYGSPAYAVGSIIGTMIAGAAISIIGLLICAGILRFIANHYKGKGKFGEIVGAFGIIGGAMAIAQIPMVFFMLAGILRNLVLMGIVGFITIPITSALSTMVTGELFELISAKEKLSVTISAMVYGATIGLIVGIFILITYAVFVPLTTGITTMPASSSLPAY